MNSENEREYNEQIDRLMHNIKIRNTNGKGSPSQILINDKEFPVTALQFNLDMENHNKAEISILVHKCDFEVNADLVLNGVIVGIENERRLYEQLKEKFEPKKKIGEVYMKVNTDFTQDNVLKVKHAVDRIIKNLLDRRGLRQEFENIDTETKEEIRISWMKIIIDELLTCIPEEPEWISVKDFQPANTSDVETIGDRNTGMQTIVLCLFQNGIFYSGDHLITPTHWRYKK
jgi:hypothetical protein